MLTETEINKIFSWLPYREDWPVDRNQREDNIEKNYGPLIHQLTQNKWFDTYYSENGSLGNYLEFICYPGGYNEYNGNAILVCISVCSPFAAYGQIIIHKEHNSFGRGAMFSPDQAYSITDPALLEIEKQINIALNRSNLYLFDKDFLSKPLPGEIANSLKTESHNEGSQYLHGIFQKTD